MATSKALSVPATGLEALIDLMDLERGESSAKQDSSARKKFNDFLKHHVSTHATIETVTVDKSVTGKFTSYLL